MAQKGVQLDWEKLCCSICLDLLKDPVTIPCGHNYCMDCIRCYWETEGQNLLNRCPQCRQTFQLKPVLAKNTVLADVVEDLKRTRLRADPEDLACDMCTGEKVKATKSCLQCQVSYCDQHLRPHYESPALENHKLVEPSKKLQENICSRHNEVMKVFCRTDQQCICYLCYMDEHKGHDTVSAAAERTDRQRELEGTRRKIQQRIQDREEDVKVLQQEVEDINHSADKVVNGSKEIISQLIHLLETKLWDVDQQVRTQQTNQLSRVEERQKKLEEELAELKKRDAELEQLSHTGDHIHFLHLYPQLSPSPASTNPPSIHAHPRSYFDDVLAAVSAVRDKVQDVLMEERTEVSPVEGKQQLSPPQVEPKTRDDFLKYSQHITLDPNTANSRLMLSEGDRRVTVIKRTQACPRHPGRFVLKQQVLGTEPLTSRHYWEVEVDVKGVRVEVAVTYDSISRTEGESAFGNNDRSWALVFSDSSYKFIHNKSPASIPGPRSSRIGVFLDHSAGVLSFYSVSKTMTLLHRVQTTFTQTLYAGLSVYGYENSVKLCELK